MPELPEVEVLVRHLAPLLKGRKIRQVTVHRPKVLAPTSVAALKKAVVGATFTSLERRGKYLLFQLRKDRRTFTLLGHLGMTGRFFLTDKSAPLPKHAAAWFELDRFHLIYEDTRYFGRLTLDTSSVDRLGPEPLDTGFTAPCFADALKRSTQAIKVKLLDQSLVAGVGNIYASEALFRAGISPRTPAHKLKLPQIKKLRFTIRAVLTDAIRRGSTIPLNFNGDGERDGLFYFGRAENAADYYVEHLQVYDRAGKPCIKCKTPVKRIVQAARSTFFCPNCQR